MRRLLTLTTLLVLGTLNVRTQQPSPYLTHGFSNGLKGGV